MQTGLSISQIHYHTVCTFCGFKFGDLVVCLYDHQIKIYHLHVHVVIPYQIAKFKSGNSDSVPKRQNLSPTLTSFIAQKISSVREPPSRGGHYYTVKVHFLRVKKLCESIKTGLLKKFIHAFKHCIHVAEFLYRHCVPDCGPVRGTMYSHNSCRLNSSISFFVSYCKLLMLRINCICTLLISFVLFKLAVLCVLRD